MDREADDRTLGEAERNRVDEVRARFEQACREGTPPELKSILDSEAVALRPLLFRELLRIDCDYRSRSGQPPNLAEYLARFPEFAHWIETEFGGTRAATLPTAGDSRADSPATVSATHRVPGALPEPGQVLAEFEILSKLGAGAFATVYRAWQRGVEREVALKVSTQASGESRALARLDGHPHIVRIFDERLLPERGIRLIYMEFVDGPTLKQAIQEARDKGRLHQPEWPEIVCRWGAKLADALAFAHRRGVLHCDVKPANILLDSAGRPKLVDFNVAHRTEGVDEGIGGTIPYMSPEQLAAYAERDSHLRRRRIAELDGRSDLHSLGIVLWEVATGARPFETTGPSQDLLQSLERAIESRERTTVEILQARGAKLLPGLRRVLLRCLERDPAQRHDRAEQLVRELELCAKPELQRLLYPPSSSWRAFGERHPGGALFVTAASSNLLLSGISIYYNWDLLRREGERHHIELFLNVLVPVVNFTAFFLGLFTLHRHARPVLNFLRGRPAAEAVSTVDRAVLLGDRAARICLSAWTLASGVWCVTMGRLAWGWSTRTAHFTGSIFLCGVLASGLTFFAVTRLSTAVFLPALLREGSPPPRVGLEKPLARYFSVLFASPLVAVLLFLFARNDLDDAKPLLACLLAIGFAAIALSSLCARLVRRDLQILSEVSEREQAV